MNWGVLRAVGYKTSETFVETGVVQNSADNHSVDI